MSTIKDVARESGLSIGTVSKYLNGGSVRPGNRAAIEEAIRNLDYQVNPFARSLKTKTTRTIGVVFPTLNAPFFGHITLGLDRALLEHGYNCIVCSYNFSAEMEGKKLEFLVGSRVDGIVYVPEYLDADDLIDILGSHTMPVILADRMLEGFHCDAVLGDNLNAVYRAVEKFIDRQHRRIGIILGPLNVFTAQERFTGYRRVMEDYNLPIDNALVLSGNYDIESGHRLFNQLMDLENPPTAICVTNYDLTLGAITAAHERGIRLPEDLEMVGYDCVETCRLLSPPMPVIGQPMELIGETAGRFMLERLNGAKLPPRVARLKSDLILN